MATIEEARSKLKARLARYKIQTPTRVAFLGDGRGNAASNMVPTGEPDKFWARESIDGDKPFKVLNRNEGISPAFNLPVLLGYPDDDPTEEQILGLHRALVKFSTGGTSSSIIGGVGPHHTQHEWGGGDETYIDPRMFKPGLVKPTSPAGMTVKVLSFEHYVNTWSRYDGGTTPDFTQYKPSSNYRYILITLEPDSNSLRIHPGNVFSPDLSIDSIISNNAKTTFRHIPTPPGNEIPLGVVLLESDTAKIDWNINGVNNLMPMRLLLGTPQIEINNRLNNIESTLGVGGLPTTGAANSVQDDFLPTIIDGNINKFVHARAATSQALPVLLVGEFGYANDNPSSLVIGTASGNKVFVSSGGGGATELNGLTDVTIADLNGRRVLAYDNGASVWSDASMLRIPALHAGDINDNGDNLIIDEQSTRLYANTANGKVQIFTENSDGILIGGTDGTADEIEFNASTDDMVIRFINSAGTAAEFVSSFGNPEFFRFNTATISSGLLIDYTQDEIIFNTSTISFRTNDQASALRILRATNEIVASAVDFTIATSVNSEQFVVDNALGAVQAGTSVAGQIADLRDHLVEFNKNRNDQDFVIRSALYEDQLYVDAANGRVGIGTSAPSGLLQIGDLEIDTNDYQLQVSGRLRLVRSANGTVGTNVSYNGDTTDGNDTAILGMSTSTTGVGGTTDQSVARIHAVVDTHAHATRSAHWYFLTAQNGTNATRMSVGAGVDIGTPTSGGDLAGWMNVQNGIQRNGTAYTNPDYAVEHYFNNGSIVKFANNPGAASYNGLIPLAELEDYLETNLHLPNRWESINLFEWADMAQMWSEELAIYITQLHNRVTFLESELQEKVHLENRLNILEARLLALEKKI